MKTNRPELTEIQRIDLMIESMGGKETLEERWKKEQAKRDAAIRELHYQEYLRERARMERRNLIRDLFGL